jgi:hypothetical protein
MTNPLAFVLVVIAAFCFACAAVLQHRAVATEPRSGALALRGLRDVTRSPLWRLGLLLAASGSTLHAVALVFAPLSVIQPVGVLAVPIAVVLAAAHTRRKPTAGMLVGILLSSACVVAFVTTVASSVAGTPASGGDTALAGFVVGLVLLVLAVIGLSATGWLRCVALAMAGATAFGLVSALVRAVSQTITSGLVGIVDPTVLIGVAAVMAAVLTGGWLVQQAFASGPPEVVVSCLTVVDPVVAVLFGVILLGEGNAISPAQWAVLSTAAVGGIVGVAVLARHHPEAAARKIRV